MKYIKLLLLCAGVIYLALAEDYGYLNLDLPRTALRPGTEAAIQFATSLPIEYAYIQLGSGETYILENIDSGIFSKTISLPLHALEGYLPYALNLVLPENQEAFDTRIPQSRWRQQAGRNILVINRRIYLTRQTEIEITLAPPVPVPGQKVLVIARTPFIPESAGLVYGNRRAEMELSGTLFSAELTAEKSENIRVRFLSDGKIIEQSVSLNVYQPAPLPKIISATVSENIEPQEKDDIAVRGQKSIVFINRQAQGETDFIAEQKREETLYLEASGRESSVNIAARVFATTQETADKKEDIMLKLWTERWSAYMGDFNETVSDNVLALNNKNLNGFKFSYFPGASELTAIIGKELGIEQEEYLYGTDSQGPYSILYPPAVRGSEQIFLDNQLLLRDKDYYFDHQGGKIIFRQHIVGRHQLIKILYQSEVTPYKNQFTYARAAQNLGGWHLRIDGAQAKDILEFADAAVSVNTPPRERKQYSAQILYRDTGLTMNIEKALTEENILDGAHPVTRNLGEAENLNLQYDNQENLRLSLSELRSTEKYAAIGTAVQPGSLENRHFAEFYQPDYLLRADTYQRRQSLNDTGAYEKENYYKLFIRENFLPEIQYWHKTAARELISVSSTENIIHRYTGQNLELAQSLNENFRLGLTGAQEEIENTLDELSLEERETYGAYLQTQQLTNADFIIGKKVSQRKLLNDERLVSSNTLREENYTRLNIYPNNRIRFGTAYQQILDDTAGNSEILEADYSLAPWEQWNSNGNYSVETLLEDFVSKNYRTQKQRGNFLMRYQPLRQLRATLRYAPNISLTAEALPYAFSESQSTMLDITPWHWTALKYAYTGQRAYSKDTARLAENILNNENQQKENMYVWRILPLEILDLEFKYRRKDKTDNFLDELLTANLLYSEGSGFEAEKGLNIYYRPSKQIQLTTGYNFSEEEMDYLNLPSLNISSEREQYSADLQYHFTEQWTCFVGCDFFKITDFLVSENNITYEYTPNLGISCRYTEFRLHYDYQKTESTLGQKSLRHRHRLNLEYYWSSYLQSSLSVEQVKSEIPAYETMDLLGKISASF